MKKQLLKNLRLRAVMLVALLCAGVCGAWGETVTYTFSEHYSSNSVVDGTAISLVENTITATFNKRNNGTATQYYTNGTAVRWYGGGTLIIAASDATITGVVITYAQTANTVTANTGTYSLANMIGTWSGSASSITFSQTGTTGNCQITSIKVTYTKGTEPGPGPSTGTEVTFTAGTDVGSQTESGNSDSMTKNSVTISSDNASFATTQYRLYSSSKTKFTVTSGTITKIEFTEASKDHPLSRLSVNVGTLSNGVWTGNTNSVQFTANGQVRVSSIVVTVVSDDTKEDPELAYTTTSYTVTVNSSFETPTLTNPYELPVTYSISENEGVASINASTGAVTIGSTPGTVTVTASFAGNETYHEGTARYIITVTPQSHTATFMVNGSALTSVSVEEGSAITFPADPVAINDKVFMGWTAAALTGVQETAPTMVTSATMGTADVTYYAVFATQGDAVTSTVTLTNSDIVNAGKGSNGYRDLNITDSKGKTWTAYAIKDQHSNATSSYHFLQIKKYASNTAYYIQVPEYGTKITNLTMTVSNTQSPMNGNNNTSTVFFSANNKTAAAGEGVVSRTGSSSISLNCSSLNLNTGYITADGGVRIWDITVTYSDVSYSGYCTTVPNTATFTLSENCYDLNNGTKTYYGTYSNSSAFVVPEDLTVAEVSVEDGVLTVTPYSTADIVPANTGVMVSSEEPGLKTVILTTETGTAKTTNNMLRPTGTGITSTQMAAANSGCKFYYLTMNGEQIGFYRRNDTGDEFDMPVANKAYLAVPEGQVGNIKDFSFNDIVDGIKAVETTETESKAIYNLAGQRVSKMQKGIYIVNGKKVLVK